jgi:hypothetical protein
VQSWVLVLFSLVVHLHKPGQGTLHPIVCVCLTCHQRVACGRERDFFRLSVITLRFLGAGLGVASVAALLVGTLSQ